MADRVIEDSGRRWRVALSGRRTQYGKDELGVVFAVEGGSERRIARFSPLATKSAEFAGQFAPPSRRRASAVSLAVTASRLIFRTLAQSVGSSKGRAHKIVKGLR
jgi:hypothetical protein